MAEFQPNALLRGGPEYLTDDHRVRYVEHLDEKLKLPIGNGYEHFTPTPDEVQLGSDLLRVFVWSARTCVAE